MTCFYIVKLNSDEEQVTLKRSYYYNVQRVFPSPQHFIILQPGESISAIIEFASHYDLTRHGTYSVSVVNRNSLDMKYLTQGYYHKEQKIPITWEAESIMGEVSQFKGKVIDPKLRQEQETSLQSLPNMDISKIPDAYGDFISNDILFTVIPENIPCKPDSKDLYKNFDL